MIGNHFERARWRNPNEDINTKPMYQEAPRQSKKPQGINPVIVLGWFILALYLALVLWNMR